MDEYQHVNEYRDYYEPDNINPLVREENMYKKIYRWNNDRFKNSNSNHIPKKEGSFRLMTWNVHYWTDVRENPTIESIAKDILEINADIVVLQEATFGETSFTKVEVSSSKKILNQGIQSLLPGYKLISFCNTVPMWYFSPYGNAILVKEKIYYGTSSIKSEMELCNFARCHFNQQIDVFTTPAKNKKEGLAGVESRCYIKISLPDFDVFAVHLSVESTDYRLAQLTELASSINRKSIIMGDFNFITQSDFYIVEAKKFWNYYKDRLKKRGIIIDDRERDFIRDKRWKDSFEMLGAHPLNYSQWAGTRVDYIFFTEQWSKEDIISTFCYFTNSSDHLPLVVDIKYNAYNIEKNIKSYGFLEPIEIDLERFAAIMKYEGGLFSEKINASDNTDEIISKIRLYNSQPADAAAWYTYEKNEYRVSQNYDFEDPYLTSTSSANLLLGPNGLYTSPGAIEVIMTYGIYFTQESISYGRLSHWAKDTYSLFVFSLRNMKDAIILDSRGKIYNYEPSDDEKYDIIMAHSPGVRTVLKFTRKNFNPTTRTHKFIKLEEIYLGTQHMNKKEARVAINNQIPHINVGLANKYNPNITENDLIEPAKDYVMYKLPIPRPANESTNYTQKYIKYKTKYVLAKKYLNFTS